MGRPNKTYDVELLLNEAGVIGASAAGSEIVDAGDGEFKGDIVIDVSALEIASDDEIYDIVLQGSSDAAFGTPGNIEEIIAISLSAKEVKRTDSDKDDSTGRYTMPFSNWRNGTKLRYLRLYIVVAGSIASGGGIDFTAFIGKYT